MIAHEETILDHSHIKTKWIDQIQSRSQSICIPKEKRGKTVKREGDEIKLCLRLRKSRAKEDLSKEEGFSREQKGG